MAQAALKQRPPRLWSRGRLLLRCQPPSAAGITATAASAALDEALPGRGGVLWSRTAHPLHAVIDGAPGAKPDGKLGELCCPGDSLGGGGAPGRTAVSKPRKYPIRDWGERHSGRECGDPRTGRPGSLSPGPAFRRERTLQCMLGAVVRRGRRSDSEVTHYWWRRFGCRCGRWLDIDARSFEISRRQVVIITVIALFGHPDFLSSRSGC